MLNVPDQQAGVNSFAILLKSIRSLTVEQFQARQSEAAESVRTEIGSEPDFNKYKVRLSNIMSAIEWLMLALLGVLFLFSIVHVLAWARGQALISYEEVTKNANAATDMMGIVFDQNTYILLQQISVLFVTELGMIALSIYHMYRGYKNGVKKFEGKGWRNIYLFPMWFISRYFFMILASLIGLSVLNANLKSGFDSFVSVLVPVITISLSEMFAQIFAKTYTARLQQEAEYTAAMAIWKNYNLKPETHPRYNSFLSRRIQDWYRRNSSYKEVEWTPQLLQYLSAREKAIHSHSMDDGALMEQMMASFNSPLSLADTPAPQALS